MHGLNHIKAAVLVECPGQRLVKALLLSSGRHGHRRAEDRVHEVLVAGIDVFGIEQGVVDICRASVEGREQEAQLRRGHNLADDGAAEALLVRHVAELRLSRFHRAHTAEHVLVHVAAIVLLPVLAVVRHVIDVIGHQDQVVLVFHVDVVDDAAVEFFPQGGVGQLALAKRGEQAVFLAVHDLLRGKGNIQQVLPQGAGQGLFQQAEVFLRLFLGQQTERLIK